MLWLVNFLHQSPEELVRALHEKAQQPNRAQGPIDLCLDVYGWPMPKVLRFVSDLILDRVWAKSPEEAVWLVVDFYLNLRMAAAFALRAQRLMETHNMSPGDAIEAWACWECGYSGLKDAPDRERNIIGERIKELRAIYVAGQLVLQVQEGKEWSVRKIRVPDPILDAIPRPSEEICWGEGEPLQERRIGSFQIGMPRSQQAGVSTEHRLVTIRLEYIPARLAAWLALPPEKIVEKVARGAESLGPVLMELDAPGRSVDVLLFWGGGIFHSSIDGGDLAGTSFWEIDQEKAILMVAERKLRLRRAAVYAAWVESEAKRHGISADDLIRLDAMATYGFASEWDIPVEARYSIQYKRSELSELHRAGLFVLNVSKSLAETPR
jgi:hypothetical protein